ncbi:PASTA domain-containing protein [Ilumatobacter nonamiensis]|uniref:PASTA domain-containing protein n=1 Tax=Ilumatobacter nonamiensis TaxID=467093 RepID=UPI00034A7E63|nr:PASTA domain-containing protein [Ilumatobacter nonamiensis]
MENVDTQRTGRSAGALEGTVLAGRYRLAQVLSSGANTVIMDAIDVQNDSPVTVKVVRPEHAQDPNFRRKFRRLAEISNALTHPNIASVTDWGEIELRGSSTVFWTVDALGGGSLRDLLDRGRLLEPGQALVLGLEACRALDAAHHKGLYHTELTPSKMVFGVDRRLRVVDFGMARLLAEPAWAESAAVPTHVARYASPEQALGLPIDAKTDVYALALVMIEAVTGSVPFAADSTVSTLAGRVDKLLPVSADLGALASVLERAGRPESADRFTAAEFGRALVQCAPRLSKPEPIPILASGTFDTYAMRRPTDPTGGVERPAPVPGLAGVDETGIRDGAGETVAPDPDAEPTDDIATSDATAAGSDDTSDVAGEGPEGLVEDSVDPDVDPGDAADEAEVSADGDGDDDAARAALGAAAAVAGGAVAAGVAGAALAADHGAPTVGAGGPGVGHDRPVSFDADDAPTVEVATTEADDAPTAEVATTDAVDDADEPGDADDLDPDAVVADEAGEPGDVDDQPVADGSFATDDPVIDADDEPIESATSEDESDEQQGGVFDDEASQDPPPVAEAAESASLAALHADLDAEAERSPTIDSSSDHTTVMPAADPSAPEPGGELFDDEPSRRRRWPIVMLVLVLLLGLGALGYAGSLLLQTKSFTVPALAGVSEDDALDQISGNDWDLETSRERSDSFPVADTVIRTVPAAGVELDEGEPFTLVLSDGPEFRTLPELDELPFNTATTELAELGLIGVEADAREFSETVPTEAVISWTVEGDIAGEMQAGAQILPGETIVMVLSQGPEPRTIPDLTTGTGPEGREIIEAMQLEYIRESDVFSDTVPSGQVVSQTPAAGEQLERGGTVTVRVSKGPDVVEFPDLEGLEFGAARDLLVETGFTVGDLLGSTQGTFVEATIDGIDVPVGEVLPRGTAVDLIFL